MAEELKAQDDTTPQSLHGANFGSTGLLGAGDMMAQPARVNFA